MTDRLTKWTSLVRQKDPRGFTELETIYGSDAIAPLPKYFYEDYHDQTQAWADKIWIFQPPISDIIEWTFPDSKITSPIRIICEPRATLGYQVFVDYKSLDSQERLFECDIFTLRPMARCIVGFNETATRNILTGHIENGNSFDTLQGDAFEQLKLSAQNKLKVFADLIITQGQARLMNSANNPQPLGR